MKMKSLLLSLLFFFFNCVNNTIEEEVDSCIDASKIDRETACYLIYAPVCGCDGKTYSNDCIAQSNGVLSFEEGACPEE